MRRRSTSNVTSRGQGASREENRGHGSRFLARLAGKAGQRAGAIATQREAAVAGSVFSPPPWRLAGKITPAPKQTGTNGMRVGRQIKRVLMEPTVTLQHHWAQFAV